MLKTVEMLNILVETMILFSPIFLMNIKYKINVGNIKPILDDGLAIAFLQ